MTGVKTAWYKIWLTTALVASLVGLGVSGCDLGRKGAESNRAKTMATAIRAPADSKTAEAAFEKKTEVVETAAISDPAPSPERAEKSEKKIKSKETKSSSPGKGKVHYKNRKEIKEAEATPLHKGDPGYSSKLDRDGDGAACEK